MITLFHANTIYSLDELSSKVAAHINQLTHTIAPTGTPLTVLRYEFPTEPIDLFTWLHNQKNNQKLYWGDRNNKFQTAGIGIADVIEGNNLNDINNIFEYTEERLSNDNSNLKYYGGIRFSKSKIAKEWQAFPAYQFIIPQFEFYKKGDQHIFALNIAVKDITEKFIKNLSESFSQIIFTNVTKYRKAPQVQSRKDIPTRNEWGENFRHAITALKNHTLKKIVLARRSIFTFDKAIDPVALTKHLADITPSSFHFCFQTSPYNGFIGATPERLFKLTKNTIKTEALAGTTSRTNDPIEDKKLANELLLSKKNIAEHNFVIDHIRQALKSLCTDTQIDSTPKLLTLPKTHHLITKFQARPTAQTTSAKLLKQLHPTPAVAGMPKKEAEESIANLETFDRGWYCGPIGYIGKNSCEFAVAIRSGLIQEKQLSLYGGAGIVEDSRCEEEWQEIETKISNFINVFKQ